MDAGSLMDEIDAAAPAAMEQYGVGQVTAGVLLGGERIARGYGVEPETTFRIASITKPLVATLALRLVEEGRLSLDEELDGLALPWDGVTLRHLLSHQAGLAGDRPGSLAEFGEDDDALQRLAAGEALAGPVGPGELFAYSNYGYWLAGAVAERAVGATFEDAMQRFVLEPLGMRRTGFSPAEPSIPAPAEYPRARRASGGLFSCVDDLLGFGEHLLGGAGPLSEASLTAMQTPQVPLDPRADYGLGLFLGRDRTRPTVEHPGAVGGFRSHLVLVPSERLAVVLLAAGEKGRLVAEALLEAVGLEIELPPEMHVSDEDLAQLAGAYRDRVGNDVAVTVHDGGLDFETDDLPVAHFRPAGPRWFVAHDGEYRGESADFPRDGLLRYGWLFERQ
jgi:CubicO group peptidase (beta-lactamase class C family)